MALATGAAAREPTPSACSTRTFETSRFTICAFDARTDALELHVTGSDGKPLRSFAALAQDLGAKRSRVRFAMNAGMYDEAGMPIGLYVENGRRRHKLNTKSGYGNFHMLPNGVFAVDRAGRVSVTRGDQFRKRVPAPLWATQSGPMLVIDGMLHPKIAPDGPSRLIRDGVCVADSQHAWFAISDDPVSFGRFARLFRDSLGCPNALFLDGTVASLWDPASGREDGYSQLGPMVVVLDAANGSAGRPGHKQSVRAERSRSPFLPFVKRKRFDRLSTNG